MKALIRDGDTVLGTRTATADDILAKVQLVQTNIKKLVDNNAK